MTAPAGVAPRRSLFGLLAEQRRFVYLAVAVAERGGASGRRSQLPSAIYPELTFSRITVVAQGSLARRAAGVVRDHAADRGGGERRAGCDARAVALDSRRQRDQRHVRAERPT